MISFLCQKEKGGETFIPSPAACIVAVFGNLVCVCVSCFLGEQEDKQAQARMILINFMQLLRVREGRAWRGKACRVDSIVFYNS